MATATIHTLDVIDGRAYLSTTARGVEYTLQRLAGAWFVSSRRLALGRGHIGGGKHYATLEAVATGCKAFNCDAEWLAANFAAYP